MQQTSKTLVFVCSLQVRSTFRSEYAKLIDQRGGDCTRYRSKPINHVTGPKIGYQRWTKDFSRVESGARQGIPDQG